MKTKLWMIILLTVLLIVVIGITLFYGDHEYEFSEEDNYPSIVVSEHEIKTKIKAWEDSDTGIVHYFLPGGIDSKTVYRGDIKKEELSFGKKNNWCIKFSPNEEYDFSYKGKEFKAVFHVIPNISSVFINTKSGSMKKINADKDKTETGNIVSISKEGTIEHFGELKKIKGHGNVTWDVDEEKKPYSIELDSKGNIGELTDVEDLLLLSMYYDGDKIHSKLALDLAQIFEPELSVRSTYVSLYLNGEYVGLYLATDPPKKLEGLNSKDSEFLIEKDFQERAEEETCFTLEDGTYFCISRPKQPSDAFIEEIEDYIQNIDYELRDGITDLIDVESFAKQFLMQQLTHNNDAFRTSVFFYKNMDDMRLYAGPAWDFDGGFGEFIHSYGEFVNTKADVFIEDYSQLEWYKILSENEEFCETARYVLENNIEAIETLYTEGIDHYEKILKEAYEAEDARWKWNDITDFYRAGNYKTWENNVRYLKYFCGERLKAICEYHGVDTSIGDFDGSKEVHTVRILDGNNELLSLSVEDGDTIKLDDYPEVKDERWHFDYFNESFYDYLPILEDLDLILYKPGG